MADYTYRNLILWQKAQDFTLAVIKLVAALPTDRVAPVVGNQLLRSASSIGANVAEGHGRFALGAHRNHLSIAKGSACEAYGWLDLLRRSGYVSEEEEQHLHGSCDELIRMLTAKIRDLERKEAERGKRIGESIGAYEAGDGDGSEFSVLGS